MENETFYKTISKYVDKLTKEELINFIENLIRKIPKDKFEEVLCMTNNSENLIDDEKIKTKISRYQKQFKQFDEGILYFYTYESQDYTYDWQDWNSEYVDKDNVSDIITNCIEYAIHLINYRKYKYAKELFDLILDTNYQVYYEKYIDELTKNHPII